jgi:FixJ family two-component response regulator
MQAMRAGAMDFLAKPFDDEVLLESVRAAMEN